MLQQSQQLLSIVVPCFNEEAVIEETHSRMTRMAARLNELEYEII
jgi:glycosyltransferase involved in cell wall biosynthesis